MQWYVVEVVGVDVGDCCVDVDVCGIGFCCCCEVDCGFGEWDLFFWYFDESDGVGGGYCDVECLGVGEVDVFGCGDYQVLGDEVWIFFCFDYVGEVVQCGVWI